MKFFLRKTLKWLAYLFLTVLFFALPVFLHKENVMKDFAERQFVQESATDRGTTSFYFEFEPGSLEERVIGDSTVLGIITKSDTSEKRVYLYVNGEKQDMAVVSDTMRIEFSRVYLRPGPNEITAVLQRPTGEILAIRKATIFSIKKM